jgi:transcriptional regulator with XRE-family HTH domain
MLNDERSANAIDKRLGERVRTRRLEIGMSQEKLAEFLRVTFQQVQKYEKGVNRLYDISLALDMPIAQFFEGLGNARAGEGPGGKPCRSIDAALSDPDALELVLTYADIKERKVRRRVLDLVRAMKEA